MVVLGLVLVGSGFVGRLGFWNGVFAFIRTVIGVGGL